MHDIFATRHLASENIIYYDIAMFNLFNDLETSRKVLLTG